MIIRSLNNLHITAPKTFTTYLESAGTNVIRWANPAGFSASWAVQLGETNEEQTEVVILGASTPSGTAGTLTANTLYEHPANTPIYGIKYDKVIFEKSSAGTAGTAAPITNGTITYQADNQYTLFDDTAGVVTDAYRVYLQNSVSGGTTSESDWMTPAGPSFYSLLSLRERVKEKLWKSDFVKDDTITNWINEWKDQMSNAVIKVNENYAMGTVNVAFGTSGLGTITTADFKQMRSVLVTYDGLNYYRSTKSDPNDFLPSQTFSSTHPYHIFHGDSVIEVKPSETAGTAKLEFYRFGTTMVNDTDELPLPMRSYTKSFVDYALAQALFKDGKTSDHNVKVAEANNAKDEFVSESSPRDRSGPTQIDLVEPITGDEWDL